MIGTAIGLLILGLAAAFIARRALQFKKLAHEGVVAEGVVIKKFRNARGTGSTPHLRYEYFGPDGRRHEYKIATTEAFFEAHAVGDRIEIVYVKSDPSISAAKYLVDQSREALKLPPL